MSLRRSRAWVALLVLAFVAGALVACSRDEQSQDGSEQSSGDIATTTVTDTPDGESAAPATEQTSSIDTSTADSEIGAASNDAPAVDSTVTGVTTQPAESRSEVPEAAELEEIVRAWYQDSDPAVCDQMTDAMLDFGWGKTGDAGREECQTNLDAAEPADDVTVRPAKINRRRPTVDVSYTITDGRNVDRITFVRRGGKWLINRVALVGFE